MAPQPIRKQPVTPDRSWPDQRPSHRHVRTLEATAFALFGLSYFDEIRSTSKTSVAFGGITPPAPRAP